MNLGIAKVALAVVVVGLIIGFAIPEMYSGVSGAEDKVDNSFLEGLPIALFGLVMVGVVLVIGVILMGVVKNA